jgi:hypothetical protein
MMTGMRGFLRVTRGPCHPRESTNPVPPVTAIAGTSTNRPGTAIRL